MIEFGRGSCSELGTAREQEWLITNGSGSYGSGTIGGIPTRRYHGLLVAALEPPLGRTLLVSHVSERLTYDDETYALGAQQWDEAHVEPRGFVHLDRFRLEGSVPVWTYTCGDGLLEKRIWMRQGRPTTFLRYDLIRGRTPVRLEIDVFVNRRGHHHLTRAEERSIRVEATDHGLDVASPGEDPFLFIRSGEARARTRESWYRDFHLRAERARGLDFTEDHLHAGTFEVRLSEEEATTLTLGTDAGVPLDGEEALRRRVNRDRSLIERADTANVPGEMHRLVWAADQFLIDRPSEADPDGCSVIAGYPWFGDWGRDTMIALPGLALRTGRHEEAARILRTYGTHVDRGMIPNRFPEEGTAPEYNTVDATLWYVEAVRNYVETTEDTNLLRELYSVLQSIVEWHRRGTRYGIGVDPEDGLLRAGEPGTQLTWMDAKIGDRAVTPRIGKPVEVNALWYDVLRSMEQFAGILEEPASRYARAARRVAEQFDRFWDPERGRCRDVVDGPDGNDARLRPNQILAVSLFYSPLDRTRQRAVVEACSSRLLTPHGLRSLSPDHSAYRGTYEGDPETRDEAYHQGTVWSWLMGPFAIAHHRVYGDRDRALGYLDSLRRHLADHGVGSISEIFDGDPPFQPRGAPAQAWSVGQLLEAYHRISTGTSRRPDSDE